MDELESNKQVVENALCKENLELIRDLFATRKMKDSTKLFYYKSFRRWLGFKPFKNKPFKKWTKQDVIKAMDWIENKNLRSATKSNYKQGLKTLFNAFELTELSKYIKIEQIKTTVKPEDLLTPEEVRYAINCSGDLRDKAFVAFLYSSITRVGEARVIRFKDIFYSPNTGTFKVRVNGKTGERYAYVIELAKIFRDFLVQHPFFTGWDKMQENDHYVWVNLSKYKRGKDSVKVEVLNKPLHYNRCNYIVKRVFRNAGISRRVYPHLLRHSGSSWDYKKNKNLIVLKRRGGWSKSSTIPERVYVHMAEADIEQELLEQNGFKVPEKKEITCLGCGSKQADNKGCCGYCGMPVNKERFLEHKSKQNSIMQEVLERIDRLEARRGH